MSSSRPQLLERDITKRLGCKHTGGIEAFKAHPWFREIDWRALAAKQITPPFEPDSKKANFDATHELEELLLEDNPLKAKKRHAQDLDQLPDELRQMEEGFKVYDYVKMGRRSFFDTKSNGEVGLNSTIVRCFLFTPLDARRPSPRAKLATSAQSSRWPRRRARSRRSRQAKRRTSTSFNNNLSVYHTLGRYPRLQRLSCALIWLVCNLVLSAAS